jgi:hypothetical protein
VASKIKAKSSSSGSNKESKYRTTLRDCRLELELKQNNRLMTLYAVWEKM